MSAPSHGTALRLLFPCADEDCDERDLAMPGSVPAEAPLTALVADDDEQVRYVIVRVLRQMGFEVLEAEDAVSARRLAQRHVGPIRILITDVMMPRIHGTGLAAWISAERPETSILLVSGFTDAPEIQRWVDEDPDVFLPKPFYPDELMDRVRKRLAIA